MLGDPHCVLDRERGLPNFSTLNAEFDYYYSSAVDRKTGTGILGAHDAWVGMRGHLRLPT